MNPLTPIPAFLTPILGRDSEIERIADVVQRDHIRLVSITGSGGVGKTRLAIAVMSFLQTDSNSAGSHTAGRTTGSMLFVPLASIRDASEVLPAIAVGLDIRGNDSTILANQVSARLNEAPTLLVLDNFEHVRAATPAILQLLAGCPHLTILITSRVALRVHGEHQIPLAPLAIPDEQETIASDQLAAIPSVALFLERSSGVAPSFAMTDENAGDIAAICRDLEGIPLAIELAAPWIRALSPSVLRARLGSRLAILTDGPEYAPERHRTLRETLGWSYQLLDEREKIVLRRCAVLKGSWPLIAAEAFCTAGPIGISSDELLRSVGTLVDHSLLFPIADDTNAPRFRMLETIREFGLEQLRESGEESIVHETLAAWCVGFAAESETHLFGPEQITWLNILDHERETIRSGALAALDEGDATSALRLAKHLGRFWLVRGHQLADHAWLERALTLDDANPADRDPWVKTWALVIFGNSWFERGELQTASEVYHAAADVAREAGLTDLEAVALLNFAIIRLKVGDASQARDAAERSLEINRSLNNRPNIGKDLVILGEILNTQGEIDHAAETLTEALAINLELGDIRVVALTFNTMGIVAKSRGDAKEARRLLEHSLELSRETQERRGIATSLLHLGYLELNEGNFARSRAAFLEAMQLRKEIGDRWAVFECAEGFVETIANDQPEIALRMLEIAASMRVSVGASVAPRAEELRKIARQALGNREVTLEIDGNPGDAIVQEAQRAIRLDISEPAPRISILPSPENIVHVAPAGSTSGTSPGLRTGIVPKLSRREKEILALIVEGFQDREIAETLFLSVRTVSWHVTNVFNKLGVNSRVAAAVLAIQEGLVEPRREEA